MIDTDKYEGHTPADEWCLVFREVDGRNKRQMLGLTVTAYHLGQMQACDFEDYCVAQANQDLARDAPLILQALIDERAEVKRLREENNRYLDFILWLGIEHKGKKLAWEYGDEELAEMIE